MVEISQNKDLNKFYAKKVAQNLYNFMVSYQSTGQMDMSNKLVIPNDFLEKWYSKFEHKYARDPNFIMNQQFE